ncbi:acid protease [Coniochaeta ligniaria NRRL 30616]|uniref:Acid protease n=1 Tax=Coniochaeta ligniaria NRRL 30616 TaxID=1408157 RepID=A0A1J7JT80_9PEZI|nr:acid protease [Coniochaeta ligniaria NRRL 30616]
MLLLPAFSVVLSHLVWKCLAVEHELAARSEHTTAAQNVTALSWHSHHASLLDYHSSVTSEGNDGPWSTFNLRVGTPDQDVRVLVSTASPETLVVLSEFGCSTKAFKTVPADCSASRGAMFSPNASSSWQDQGLFSINQNGVGLEANLGYSVNADFGLDTLGLGYVAGGNGPTLTNQTIGGVATASPFYLGIFGLGTQPVNFTRLGNFSTPSYLASLKAQNLIPSLSWSYTAGAMYRLKHVYGQLIFSGYDTSRFIKNTVSFTMAGDVTRDLVVSLQSIIYSGSTQTPLLSSSINVFLDSTDPFLWLPAEACRAFESAFGLVLDSATGLYLVNDSHHSSLILADAEVTFRLSDVSDGGDVVNIVLPYRAFDLTAKYPLVENTSYYFPLRQAANESQYTLGRTFFQEAYLTADYERGTFNVSQCSWIEGADENIVTIQPKTTDVSSDPTDPPSSTTPSTDPNAPNSHHALKGWVTALIVIGSIAGLAVLAGLYLFFRKRANTQPRDTHVSPQRDSKSLFSEPEVVLEQYGDSRNNLYQELHSDSKAVHVGQLEADWRDHAHEFDGTCEPVEMDAVSTRHAHTPLASRNASPVGQVS